MKHIKNKLLVIISIIGITISFLVAAPHYDVVAHDVTEKTTLHNNVEGMNFQKDIIFKCMIAGHSRFYK